MMFDGFYIDPANPLIRTMLHVGIYNGKRLEWDMHWLENCTCSFCRRVNDEKLRFPFIWFPAWKYLIRRTGWIVIGFKTQDKVHYIRF